MQTSSYLNYLLDKANKDSILENIKLLGLKFEHNPSNPKKSYPTIYETILSDCIEFSILFITYSQSY